MKLQDKFIIRIGKHLRQARLEAGYSQGDLAKFMGLISNQYISNVERGLHPPSDEMIKACIKLYGMDRKGVLDLLISGFTASIRANI